MNKKMNEEAFEEVIRNIELINDMTLYGRIGIKQNVEKLWAKMQELEADLYVANNIIAEHIDIVKKQDKMIELMAEDLGDEYNRYEPCYIEFISEDVIDCKGEGYCKECVKAYYGKLAKEAE